MVSDFKEHFQPNISILKCCKLDMYFSLLYSFNVMYKIVCTRHNESCNKVQILGNEDTLSISSQDTGQV